MRRLPHLIVLLFLGFIVADQGRGEEPKPAEENVVAANQLRLQGAIVRSDSDGFVREVSFAFAKTQEDVTAGLKGLIKIEVLDLSGMNVNDESLKNIEELTNIELLVLARTKVSDAGLARLAGMKKLTGLDLSGAAVTGSGLTQVKQFQKLRDLFLDRTEIRDEHLELLAELPSLESVSLVGAKQVTNQGLTKLKRAAPKLIVVR